MHIKAVFDSTWLTATEKALLLALIVVRSFDAEGQCAFYPSHWSEVADKLGIKEAISKRIYWRLRDANVLEPQIGNYLTIDTQALLEKEGE